MTIVYKNFTPEYFEAAYQVNEQQSGMRLDQFLLLYMTSFSREQIKKKIKDKSAYIKGRNSNHRPNTKVYEKEIVVLRLTKTSHEDEYWNGKKLELETTLTIVHEDENLFIVSKPAYMSTHPTGKHLFNCATVFLEDKFQKPTHSIHRLDRETSGIMLIGKNSKTAGLYGSYFENEQIKKCYFFIAKSNEHFKNETSFTASERLDTGGDGLRRVYINHHPEDSREGKRALTHFKIIHQEKGYVLGLAFPQTGRQHQIRVHAFAHGLPLVGDKLYLGSYEMFQRFKDLYATEEDHQLMEISRHALHALALKIPYDGGIQVFSTPLPKDLSEWIQNKLTLSVTELEKLIEQEIDGFKKE